jgi:hypothetical protein
VYDGRQGDGDPIGMLRCWPLATHSGRRPVSEIWKGNSAIADHGIFSAGFIAPCLPTKTDKVPSGNLWLHEIKHDGFRVIAQCETRCVILSEAAVASDWVEGEVTRALAEERKRKQVVLFPVRIDDAVMQTSEAWATLLQGQRNIGDFTGGKDHDGYRKSFDRLMRDLRVERPGQ